MIDNKNQSRYNKLPLFLYIWKNDFIFIFKSTYK